MTVKENAAEIAKFSPEEKEQYEESLKTYRDLKNVIDTAFDEGEAKGKVEEKKANIIKALKRGKLSIAEIAEDFEVPLDFVKQRKQAIGISSAFVSLRTESYNLLEVV